LANNITYLGVPLVAIEPFPMTDEEESWSIYILEVYLTTGALESIGVSEPMEFGTATPSPNQPQPKTELERYEGMLVKVMNGTVTAPSDRFDEAKIVAGPNRTFREPGVKFPGLPGLPVWDGNPEIFELNPDVVGLPNIKIPAGVEIESAESAVALYMFPFPPDRTPTVPGAPVVTD